MNIIDQRWEWVRRDMRPLIVIEQIGRTCYKSEDKTDFSDESARAFAKMLLARGHESVIEHISASVRFITNRGVTHELVRHRLCSFSQESTRYVDYTGRMDFIRPIWWEDWTFAQRDAWERAMDECEKAYIRLRVEGTRPEQARDVLPNALKTEIVVTANLREWRHIFELRTSPAAHPQMRALMISCQTGFAEWIPEIFGKDN